MATRTFSIPLKDSTEDEVIEITSDSLPSGDDILGILRAESARLSVWIDAAVEYYKANQIEEFVKILEHSGGEAFLDYPQYEKDQVRALDTLAAHYVRMGHKERIAKEKKKEFFTKATLLYTTADKILMYDTQHLLGRAYFCMLEGNKMDQADQQFNFVMNGSSEGNIPALLGKACICFQKKDYKQALFFYKKALRLKPDCPANVRVGLGHCYAKLGQMEMARKAFERTIELEPRNVAAIAALAILDQNTLQPEGIKSAVQGLSLAYQIEPENPVVLNHLANHFFYKGDLVKVEQLAQHSFGFADTEFIRAESCFQLARCLHKNETYDKAFRYYYQATQFASPSFILPNFGLAQMYIQRKEYSNAVINLEKILAVYPNNVETLKMLGSLYAHHDGEDPKLVPERRQKARTHLSKLIEMTPDDIEVLIDLAQLFEQVDPMKSLSYYTRVCELLEQEEMDIPPEITNNMGSIALAQGEYEKARSLYEEALEKIQMDSDEIAESFKVTIMYNLARAHELLAEFDVAEKMYKDLLRKDQGYIDAIMRLGCVARDRGQIYESSVWFKEGMAVNHAHADAWSLIGNLHMNKHEWGPAQKKFEHILKLPQCKDDAYSLVALGNIWLETLFSASRNKDKDKIHAERALNMFSKALKVQPKNMWAANGIGCVLAFKGYIQEARDIFSQVREATAEFFDVWVNIAHVYMEQRQYVAAVQMYLNAMKKFNKECDPAMLAYLARAYYRTGKLTECREALEKATGENPESMMIKFNHAFVLQKQATATMKDEKATQEMVHGAIADLKTAERIFKYIMSNREDARQAGISHTYTEQHAQSCSDLLKQAEIYMRRAKEKDEEEQRQRARQEEQREALKRKMEEEEREKEESIKRQMEDLKQTRQLYIQMTKDIMRLPDIKEESKSRGGSGRKRKGGDGEEFVNDSSDMGDWPEGQERPEGERRKKTEGKKKQRRKRERGGSDDEGEEGADRQRRKQKKKERRIEPKLSAKQSQKIKSRAFLSSEDDSSDDNRQPAPARAIGAASDGSDNEPGPSQQRIVTDSSSPTDSEEEKKKKPVAKKSRAALSDSDESGGGASPAGASPAAASSDAGGSSDDARPSRANVQSSDEEASPKKQRIKKMSSSDDDSD